MGNTKKVIKEEVIVSNKPVEKVPTQEQTKKLEGLTTISAKIRYLDTVSFTRSQIAKFLGKRYQHVRNVLETELKRPAKKEAVKA